jgi:putative hydrolase of the HAD superfamily
VDFHAESLALAQAVVNADHDPHEVTARLHAAGDAVWERSRDHQQSATIADLFTEAGLEHDPDLLAAYYDFWEPHTATHPECRDIFAEPRARGLKIGVLSNTIWPRDWHVGFFERDGVYDLIDGDVYTSEIPWTKPSPRAFEAAMASVGVERCVYVGDRLFDDVWGAHNAGLKAIHIPLSSIPSNQVGHTESTPTRWCGPWLRPPPPCSRCADFCRFSQCKDLQRDPLAGQPLCVAHLCRWSTTPHLGDHQGDADNPFGSGLHLARWGRSRDFLNW